MIQQTISHGICSHAHGQYDDVIVNRSYCNEGFWRIELHYYVFCKIKICRFDEKNLWKNGILIGLYRYLSISYNNAVRRLYVTITVTVYGVRFLAIILNIHNFTISLWTSKILSTNIRENPMEKTPNMQYSINSNYHLNNIIIGGTLSYQSPPD